ncbi:MAG: hypothetical protein ACREM9_00110 [Gemmatimonadales bacterium]
MRLNTLLLVGGVLALVFGLGFLILPATLLPIYGIETGPAIVLMSRFFGAALVQLGLALYLVRETRDPGTQRGLVLAGVLGSLAGLAVALAGQFAGLVNAMGWSTVLIYGALLLGYLTCLRGRPIAV